MIIALRPLREGDLDDLSSGRASRPRPLAAFTRADPADRSAFDAHYRRVRSDPDNTVLVIDADGLRAGMIASFTIEGDRELTYWVDPPAVGARHRI